MMNRIENASGEQDEQNAILSHPESSARPSVAKQPMARRRRASRLPWIAALVSLIVLLVAAAFTLLLLNLPQRESATRSEIPLNRPAESDIVSPSAPSGGDGSPTPVPVETVQELDERWDELAPHLFRVEVATDSGVESGTGFLIDSRGWLATSKQLVSNARRFRAIPAVGLSEQTWTEMPGLGIVALDPDYDIAIIAIDFAGVEVAAGLPLNAGKILNSSDPVMAAGVPQDSEGWLAPGAIIQTAGYAMLSAAVRRRLRQHNPVDAEDAIWVEHSAVIEAGAGGGPLVNDDGEVVGINVEGRPDDLNGYAVPVARLIALQANAEDGSLLLDADASPEASAVEPEITSSGVDAPPRVARPGRGGVPEPATLQSVDYMKQLSQQCQELHWMAENEAHYAMYQELAEHVSAAQFLMDDETVQEGLRVIIDAAAHDVTVQLSETQWPDEAHIKQLNELAAAAMRTLGNGVFAFVDVKIPSKELQSVDGKPSVLFQLIGTEQFVVVVTRENPLDLRTGTRWLLLGQHDVSAEFRISPDPEKPEQTAQLVRAKYLVGEPEKVIEKPR